MLPFGLRSAPKVFNAAADALHWVLQRAGIPHIRHYLDDFIIVSPPESPQCAQSLEILHTVCHSLGVPLAEDKQVGPTTCLTFLGIEIDTRASQLRLPLDKLTRLQSLLSEWGSRKHGSRKELESLVGHLNHACKVVRSGRSFLRCILDLLHSVHLPPHSQRPIRLNAGFRSDIAWWSTFVSGWNGVSFLPPPSLLPETVYTTDASGSWGCGAWHLNSWFHIQWDQRSQGWSIAAKELVPIIMGLAAWGSFWRGCRVLCRCDNQVVVASLRSRSSKDKQVMHLLRSLLFIEAHYQCYIHSDYISTVENHLADDLSRGNVFSFLCKVSKADPHPTPVCLPLLDLLLDPTADWTSQHWQHQFRAIFREV